MLSRCASISPLRRHCPCEEVTKWSGAQTPSSARNSSASLALRNSREPMARSRRAFARTVAASCVETEVCGASGPAGAGEGGGEIALHEAVNLQGCDMAVCNAVEFGHRKSSRAPIERILRSWVGGGALPRVLSKKAPHWLLRVGLCLDAWAHLRYGLSHCESCLGA